ncbi:hypothetical protein C8R46DRAFT_482350 [Mycena filopes]|nr:hypothetical protein C8R46DRAFT_482350 [Mycena filopes]
MEALSGPILPPELERTIFELAALTDRTRIPNLVLVAWRVKTWLEPLLYQTIILSPSRAATQICGLPIFNHDVLRGIMTNHERRAHFRHLRALIFDSTPETLPDLPGLLETCPGLTKIFALLARSPDIDRHRVSALGALNNLTHLTADLGRLFAPYQLDFAHPLFRNITHLELWEGLDFAADWDRVVLGVASLPKLTHIAFNYPPRNNFQAITTNTQLRCIVDLCDPDDDDEPVMAVDDVRVVRIHPGNYLHNWVDGAEGREDYWTRADALILAKRAMCTQPMVDVTNGP